MAGMDDGLQASTRPPHSHPPPSRWMRGGGPLSRADARSLLLASSAARAPAKAPMKAIQSLHTPAHTQASLHALACAPPVYCNALNCSASYRDQSPQASVLDNPTRVADRCNQFRFQAPSSTMPAYARFPQQIGPSCSGPHLKPCHAS